MPDVAADFVVAVDSGGTFSDCVVIDRDGAVTTGKAPSTPWDYSEGVLAAVSAAAAKLELGETGLLERTLLFAHGTTVATNALLTRTGAMTGLLTTRGHEDAVIIGRTFQKVAGLTEAEMTQVSRLNKPKPVVPRTLIEGVDERIDARGNIVVPLSSDSLERALDRLLEGGVESLGVCFLWSFLNSVHERFVRTYVEARHPDLPLTLSSELAPMLKEYERTITVAINAYLTGRTGQYLGVLVDRLRQAGYERSAVVMQSSGGVTAVERAQLRAVNLLTSGPAGGVMAAATLARLLEHKDVITTDVGGTSFDVGLIVNSEPQFAEAPIFAGFQVVAPMIDVATIGAGGGSIAWIEEATGILRVGPQSAGADPGPAAYARGGIQATVTDANVVLGRLNPDYFLGGQGSLDRDAAERAVREQVAQPLGMTTTSAALAIVRIADAHMSDLVRRVSIERGYDPRRFVVYAFGGAGPLHVGAYAATLRAAGAVVPAFASEFSAFGIAASDLLAVAELSEPAQAPLDPGRLATIFSQLEEQTAGELRRNGVGDGQMTFTRFIRLRYRGQVHELRTPVPPLNGSDAPLIADFERLYEAKFGRGAAYKQAGIQAMTYIVHGHGSLYHPSLAEERVDRRASRAASRRPVVFEAGELDTTIYRLDDLHAGAEIVGPALIEAPTTTVLLHPGQSAELDRYRNLMISFDKGG